MDKIDSRTLSVEALTEHRRRARPCRSDGRADQDRSCVTQDQTREHRKTGTPKFKNRGHPAAWACSKMPRAHGAPSRPVATYPLLLVARPGGEHDAEELRCRN